MGPVHIAARMAGLVNTVKDRGTTNKMHWQIQLPPRSTNKSLDLTIAMGIQPPRAVGDLTNQTKWSQPRSPFDENGDATLLWNLEWATIISTVSSHSWTLIIKTCKFQVQEKSASQLSSKGHSFKMFQGSNKASSACLDNIPLLQVIPGVPHYFAIVSDISSWTKYGIYVLTSYSGSLSNILFWHPFWHLFCHFLWHSIWHLFGHSLRHRHLTASSRLRSGSAHWDLELTVAIPGKKEEKEGNSDKI